VTAHHVPIAVHGELATPAGPVVFDVPAGPLAAGDVPEVVLDHLLDLGLAVPVAPQPAKPKRKTGDQPAHEEE
jgi:hypothetical protein